jgi:hypothetical protein
MQFSLLLYRTFPPGTEHTPLGHLFTSLPSLLKDPKKFLLLLFPSCLYYSTSVKHPLPPSLWDCMFLGIRFL